MAARAAARLRPTTAVPWAYAPVQTAAPRRIYHQPCSSDRAGYAFLKRHLTVLAGLAGAASLPCAALTTTAGTAVSRSSASRGDVRAGADYADRLAVREGTSRTPADGARSIQFVSWTANNHGNRSISREWRSGRAAPPRRPASVSAKEREERVTSLTIRLGPAASWPMAARGKRRERISQRIWSNCPGCITVLDQPNPRRMSLGRSLP